ncbi:hypothetical protein ACNSPG_16165 [Brucella pituitosa]|uniref:hypothetical protein n=1 Tax=Brucella pituitosa TaxID=571256 RepID=UPI003C77F3C5
MANDLKVIIEFLEADPDNIYHLNQKEIATLSRLINTRPAAPVEGMETKGWEVTRYDNDGRWLETSLHIVEPRITGSEPTDTDELVTRSQAEAIIAAERADYEEVIADKRRLTRLLDVAMHGEEGAAKQASLCDLIEPAKQLRADNAALTARVKELENSRAEILNQQDKGWRELQTRAEALEAKLAAARSALTMIAKIELSFPEELRDIARAALEAKS